MSNSSHSGSQPTTEDSVQNRGRQLSNARILLADDNAEILDHVSHMLDADYEVIGQIADGNAGPARLGKELHPDLIVLDISFGECSGIEIARRLQEQGYMGEIVFLTGARRPRIHKCSDRSRRPRIRDQVSPEH